MDDRQRLAAILFEAANGLISGTEAIRRAGELTGLVWDDTVDGAWHALKHYEIDEDIHRKDPDYAHGQREGLRLWAKRLGG